jgi:hypothetical protein
MQRRSLDVADFKIEIEGIGDHGCDRSAKDGKHCAPCHQMGCPDCELRRHLNSFYMGGTVKSARMIHYPGTDHEIVDEFKPDPMTGSMVVRRVKGSF